MSIFLFIPASLSFGLIQTTNRLGAVCRCAQHKQECTQCIECEPIFCFDTSNQRFSRMIVFSDVYQGDSPVGTLHLTSVMLAVGQSLMIVRPYRYMEEA